MVEEIIGALLKAGTDAGVSFATVILLVVSLCLGFALRYVYLAKEAAQLRFLTETKETGQRHAQEMLEAAKTMATLVEQLRALSEGQHVLTEMISTAAQNAAANRETVARIEGMLGRN